MPRIEAGSFDGEWIGDWEAPETYRGVWRGTYIGANGEPVETEFRGVFLSDDGLVSDDGAVFHRDPQGARRHLKRQMPGGSGPGRHDFRQPGSNAQPVGYTPQQRADWLNQCRARYWQAEASNGGNGALVGGLLGAAIGGFAGNRIADGDRLLGTVIGAGVGGVAGAVIGDSVDGSSRRAPEAYVDACEDYLLRYERSYAEQGYSQAPGYGPVRWVRVPIRYEDRPEIEGIAVEPDASAATPSQ
ncbi:hypothetical protein FHS61_000956 [Altererythrobacter atlanticus]|nr:glycine zipper domain-containing protein [Croceibacterium atlanticum]MBB5731952.1 hypothetical protein [Croceibacterium atlanticum]